MSIEKKIKKEMKGPELVDLKLENEWGKFTVKEDESGSVTIEVFNKNGEKFVLNSLLPDEWKFVCYNRTTKADVYIKEIQINEHELKSNGWQSLLVMLHEIGHGVIFESDPQQQELYAEFENLRHHYNQFKNDPKTMQRFNSLHSKIERDAWAYAIRQLKKILEKLDIDITEIFRSNADIKEYVFEWLVSYKEWGKEDIRNMEISEDEKGELFEEINNLYVKEKNK